MLVTYPYARFLSVCVGGRGSRAAALVLVLALRLFALALVLVLVLVFALVLALRLRLGLLGRRINLQEPPEDVEAVEVVLLVQRR